MLLAGMLSAGMLSAGMLLAGMLLARMLLAGTLLARMLLARMLLAGMLLAGMLLAGMLLACNRVTQLYLGANCSFYCTHVPPRGRMSYCVSVVIATRRACFLSLYISPARVVAFARLQVYFAPCGGTGCA